MNIDYISESHRNINLSYFVLEVGCASLSVILIDRVTGWGLTSLYIKIGHIATPNQRKGTVETPN